MTRRDQTFPENEEGFDEADLRDVRASGTAATADDNSEEPGSSGGEGHDEGEASGSGSEGGDDENGGEGGRAKTAGGEAGDKSGGKRILQTFVFSATLTLPMSLKKRLRKGGGGSGAHQRSAWLISPGHFMPIHMLLDALVVHLISDLNQSSSAPIKLHNFDDHCHNRRRLCHAGKPDGAAHVVQPPRGVRPHHRALGTR